MEPFFGGGGMYFGVLPKVAIVNDINSQLINFHKIVRDNPRELRENVERLKGWDICSRELFMQRRTEYNALLNGDVLSTESAAYFYWLNRHCFNGLYRVNPRGEFNVSWNKEEDISKSINSILPSIERFEEMSKALKNADILCGDFRALEKRIGEGDIVFLDPPYLPDPKGGDFTSYTKDGFSMEDHQAVVELAMKAVAKGAYVIATNNDSPLTREMWKGFHFHEYSTSQCICPGRKRVEVAMTSWKPDQLDTIDRFC